MSDIVEQLEAWIRPAGTNVDLPFYREAIDEIKRLQQRLKIATDQCVILYDEVERLRAKCDNWEAVCSGSIKEQFRLARENEARLKLALEQLDKAATEIRRLNGIISAGADRKK